MHLCQTSIVNHKIKKNIILNEHACTAILVMYVMVRMLSYDGMLVVMWQYGYSHVTICLLSCDNMLVLVVTSLVYYNVCSLCLDSRVTTEHVWKPVVVFKLCLFVEAQNISIVHQLSRSLLMHLSNSIAVHAHGSILTDEPTSRGSAISSTIYMYSIPVTYALLSFWLTWWSKLENWLQLTKLKTLVQLLCWFYITNQATVVVCVIRNEYIARNCNTFTVIH